MLLIGAPGVAKDRAAATPLFEKGAAQGHAGSVLRHPASAAIKGDGKSPPDIEKTLICFVVRRKRATMTGTIPMACKCATDAASRSTSPPRADGWSAPPKGGGVALEVEYAIMLFNGMGVDWGRGQWLKSRSPGGR